ncbi:MAG: acyltransferase [Acidimicrobiales bacterium]|nr:acyltransferase [Acidimicrobiales bacterium]
MKAQTQPRRPAPSSAASKSPQLPSQPPNNKRLALQRVGGLDGLRVLGAIGVVIYHTVGAVADSTPKVIQVAPPMAFTFFIISGFVLYRPLARAHMERRRVPSPTRFWIGRIIRVMPLWWTAVTIYLLVNGTDSLKRPIDWFVTYASFQYVVRDARYAVIGPAWALSVEWIFYMSVPVFALALRSLNRRFFPRVEPVRIQLSFLIPLLIITAIISTTRPFMAILVGMVLSVVEIHQAQTNKRLELLRVLGSPGFALGVTVVAAVVLAFYEFPSGLSVQWLEQDPFIVVIWIVVATAWFGTVAFGRGNGIITKHLGSPLMARLSVLTFGLYVWHDLVLHQVTSHLGTDAHLGAALFLTLLGSILLATFTYLVIERPLMSVRYQVNPPVQG